MSKTGRLLLVVVFALICLGLVMTYSASAMYAQQKMGSVGHYFWRQFAAAVLGFIALFVCAGMNPYWIRRRSYIWLLASLFLLTLVFIPFIGRPAGGAHRWIGWGAFRFQPAEFVKLAVCIYLADYLARKRTWISTGKLRALFGPGVIMLVLGGMIVIQPDFGSVAMLSALAAILFFLAGIKLRYIATVGVAAIPFLGFLIALKPYRVLRVLTYLNPWNDAQGSGFQIIQSYIAFGLGGMWGVGLGSSTQKLFYLPQSHTDFIFAIIGEEWGFFGTIAIVALFGLFLFCGIKISLKAESGYLRLVSAALVMAIALQALVNMLVTTGMLPTKGLPLPFLSYGGSALLFNMIAVGLLLGVDRKSEAACASL